MKTKKQIEEKIKELLERKEKIVKNNEIFLALDFLNMQIIALRWAIGEKEEL